MTEEEYRYYASRIHDLLFMLKNERGYRSKLMLDEIEDILQCIENEGSFRLSSTVPFMETMYSGLVDVLSGTVDPYAKAHCCRLLMRLGERDGTEEEWFIAEMRQVLQEIKASNAYLYELNKYLARSMSDKKRKEYEESAIPEIEKGHPLG